MVRIRANSHGRRVRPGDRGGLPGVWSAATWLGALLVLPFAGGMPVRAAEDVPGGASRTAIHEWVPSRELAAAAAARAVPTAEIEWAGQGAERSPGDTVVMLVALEEGPRQAQWLVRLQGPLPAADTGERAPGRDTVVYSPDGREIRFSAKSEQYSILALGPWSSESPAAPIPEREALVVVNAGLLDERMVEAAAFMFRAGRARKEGRLRPDEMFTLTPRPPREPDLAFRARFASEAGLTAQSERAVAASVPMLTEFARVIAETPGLREVLFAVVDRPSLWSVLSRFGRIDSSFQFHSGDVVPSMGAPVGFAGIGRSYQVPFTFSINGRAALECTMLVAEARPPLRMCSGIVALVATSPQRPGARLIVRVVAARAGVASR